MFARLVGIDCDACPHVSQALSGALDTYVRALGTYVSSCTNRIARLFFMLEPRSPHGATGNVAALEPTPIRR
jgi:hypothetical protein